MGDKSEKTTGEHSISDGDDRNLEPQNDIRESRDKEGDADTFQNNPKDEVDSPRVTEDERKDSEDGSGVPDPQLFKSKVGLCCLVFLALLSHVFNSRS